MVLIKKGKSIIWGLILLALGITLGLHALGLVDFNVFFKGWWTLFIIIPSLIGLFTDDNKGGSFFLLVLGILLLLASRDIIEYSLVGKLIVPLIIVVIGASLLLKNIFNKKINKSIEDINSSSKMKNQYNAIFSSEEINLDNQEFNGASLNTAFGGIELDLRKAIIKKDVVISGKAIFGGIDIYVPDNVKVEVKSNSIFGGVDNKNKSDNNGVTIYIDATCVFGGIDIK